MSMKSIFGEVIHSYTRANAIKNGALKDISGLAKEVGFIYPVAVTRAVWDSCIKWGKECPAVQDEDGRTWDLLVMAVLAGKQTALVDVVKFKLECLDALGNKNEIDLQLRVHGGDQGEPVFTISLPSES